MLARKPDTVRTEADLSPTVVILSDQDEAAPEGEGTSAPVKGEASTTKTVHSPSSDVKQPHIIEAQPPETSKRKGFPFQLRLPKKHQSDPKPLSAEVKTHEEV
jgi:hypothetical protein